MPEFCVDGAALAPCPAPGTHRSLNTLGSGEIETRDWSDCFN